MRNLLIAINSVTSKYSYRVSPKDCRKQRCYIYCIVTRVAQLFLVFWCRHHYAVHAYIMPSRLFPTELLGVGRYFYVQLAMGLHIHQSFRTLYYLVRIYNYIRCIYYCFLLFNSGGYFSFFFPFSLMESYIPIYYT